MMVTRLSAGSSHGPMFKWVMPESIRCRWSIARRFAIELCSAALLPGLRQCAAWTVALLVGSLFEAAGGIVPECEHVFGDTRPQSFGLDPEAGAAVHCASDIGIDPCKFVGAFRNAGIYDPTCAPSHRSGVCSEVLPLDIIESLNWPS